MPASSFTLFARCLRPAARVSIVYLRAKMTTKTAKRTLAVSFRVPCRLKGVPGAPAVRANRSVTNMIAAVLFAFSEQHDLNKQSSTPGKAKGAYK